MELYPWKHGFSKRKENSKYVGDIVFKCYDCSINNFYSKSRRGHAYSAAFKPTCRLS